jgi:hypothetical protein
MTIPAHPLSWPTGWPRSKPTDRRSARFVRKDRKTTTHTRGDGTSWQSSYTSNRELSINDAIQRLRGELQRMGIRDDDLVISSNLELRLDGWPRSGQREPADPGVAVYWTTPAWRAEAPRCMAIDQYDRVADNIAAVAASLEALRAVERHGGARILERAFAGFTALPGPAAVDWRDVLDPGDPEGSYMRLRSKTHPDRGGSREEFQRVQQAWTSYCEEVGHV